MRKQTLILCWMLTAALLPLSAAAAALDCPPPAGTLFGAGEDGEAVTLPLLETRIEVTVSNFVARIELEQRFANPFDVPVEAFYTFPLPPRAAVDGFELETRNRIIRGVIQPKEEARKTYEAARDEGRQAALLVQERPDIFTQNVANLEPSGEVRVRLQAVQTLAFDDGVWEWVMPLTIAPRYGGDAAAEPWLDRVSGVESAATACADGQPIPAVTLDVSIDAGIPIRSVESPTHDIRITQAPEPHRTAVSLAPGDRIPDRDFVLRWSVGSDAPELGLVAHRTGVDGYFTLILQPNPEAVEVPPASKEVVFVIDTSGSMSGQPLSHAKHFVRDSFESLSPDDLFNIVRFSGDTSHYEETPIPATRKELDAAFAWIDSARAGGGTEILGGVERAVATAIEPDRYRMVIFLTDGQIGYDDGVIERVAELPEAIRIFTVGLGDNPNSSLLRRMAEVGHGATITPRGKRDILGIERFRDWIRLPHLTDVTLDWGHLPVDDLTVSEPRTLFAGENLVVAGRYFGGAEGQVIVRGYLDGIPWEQAFPVRLPDVEEEHAAIASVWAREQIETLLNLKPGKPSRKVVRQVTDLALEHRLVSPYTSFVAVDDVVVSDRPPLPMDIPPVAPKSLPTSTLSETVTVAAHAPVVDISESTLTTRFSDRFIADLPVQGRAYHNVLTLAPGVGDANGGGVHGSRARPFRSMVGGVSNVDPITGRTSMISMSDIEEMEIIANGAGVEFGGAQGGFAQIIQKQGGNDFEGELGFRIGDQGLNSTPVGGREGVGQLARYAANILGPIVKDRLWYRVTADRVDHEEPLNTPRFLMARRADRRVTSAGVTWQASDRNKLRLDMDRADIVADRFGAGNLVPAASSFAIDDSRRTFRLRWIAPVSPRLFTETQLDGSSSRSQTKPWAPGAANECLPGTPFTALNCRDLADGTWSGPAAGRLDDRGDGFALRNDTTYYMSRSYLGVSHELKAGFEIGNRSHRRDQRIDGSIDWLASGDAGSLLLATPEADRQPVRSNFDSLSVYFRDRMRITQSASIEVGLRFERDRLRADGKSVLDPQAEDLLYEQNLATGQAPEEAARLAYTAAAAAIDYLGASDSWKRRRPAMMSLDDDRLGGFIGFNWDPWGNGRTRFSWTARREYEPLPQSAGLIEQAPGFVLESWSARAVGDVWELTDDGNLPGTTALIVDRELRAPRADRYSFSVKRELFTEATLELVWELQERDRQRRTVETNRRADGSRINPFWSTITRLESSGRGRQESVLLNFNRRQYRGWEMNAWYRYSQTTGDHFNMDPLQIFDPVLLNPIAGPADDDRQHQAKLAASTSTPWGIRMGIVIGWESGTPFSTLERSFSLDGTTGTPLPELRYVDGRRNDRRNPSFWTIDARFVREFRLGRGLNGSVGLAVFNLLDDQTRLIAAADTSRGLVLNDTQDAFWRQGRQVELLAELRF